MVENRKMWDFDSDRWDLDPILATYKHMRLFKNVTLTSLSFVSVSNGASLIELLRGLNERVKD